LKPANVMFRDDGTIALVDFGSARRDADPVARTLAGVVIGTPYYLSPEMHKTAPIPKLPEPHARHQRFLERLVSKNPDERYRSAAQALDALMEYMTSDSERVVAA
jgi:serine/threonine-protein kinase PpkA